MGSTVDPVSTKPIQGFVILEVYRGDVLFLAMEASEEELGHSLLLTEGIRLVAFDTKEKVRVVAFTTDKTVRSLVAISQHRQAFLSSNCPVVVSHLV